MAKHFAEIWRQECGNHRCLHGLFAVDGPQRQGGHESSDNTVGAIHLAEYGSVETSLADDEATQGDVVMTDYCERCVLRVIGAEDNARAQVQVRTLRKDERLYRAGDKAEFVYCLRRGAIGEFQSDVDGGHELLGLAIPGDACGLDAIDGERYTTDAIAMEVTETCAIPMAVIRAALENTPGTPEAVVRALSDQLARVNAIASLHRRRKIPENHG